MQNSQEPQLLQCHCKYVGSKEMFIMIHPCPLGAVARATKTVCQSLVTSICCYFHKWNKFHFISLKSWMTPAERTKQTKLIQVDQVITSPKNWIPKPAITTNHGWQPFQVSMLHGIVKPGSAHPFSWNSSKLSTTQPKRIRSGECGWNKLWTNHWVSITTCSVSSAPWTDQQCKSLMHNQHTKSIRNKVRLNLTDKQIAKKTSGIPGYKTAASPKQRRSSKINPDCPKHTWTE